MGLRFESLSSRQAVIDKNRLAELLQIEFRHTGYMRAAEMVSLMQHTAITERDKARQSTNEIKRGQYLYWCGYLDALKSSAELSIRMVAQIIDAHPEHDDGPPPPIRKGQLCLYRARGCYCLVLAREHR